MPAVGPTSGLSILNAIGAYRIDAVLTAAESRGLLKILSRPRIVTQNNIQAVVRQGVRIPVVTAAQLGGPPTTTYVDAFLRLTVTPQITVENTIFLNVDVENTVPDFSQQVQGNPTLNTQQALTQVLVTDGGTVVIGGVIQTQNSVHIDQVPLLGYIPALGNLFKHRAVSTQTRNCSSSLLQRSSRRSQPTTTGDDRPLATTGGFSFARAAGHGQVTIDHEAEPDPMTRSTR